MKKVLIGALALSACGTDLGRKKKKENFTAVVQPVEEIPIPKEEPKPEPKPDPQPEPKPDPNVDVTAFMDKTNGRWLASCLADQDKKTSQVIGIDIHKSDFAFLIFKYPDNNTDCHGGASPNDGMPVIYSLDFIKLQKDGWFLFKGSCRSGGCSGSKLFMVKNDRFLYVREVKDESNTNEGTTMIYSNGPSR